MKGFYYENGDLYCEKVSIADLVEEYGTPLYLYSKNMVIDKFKKYDDAFADVPHNVCYALKANSNFRLLELLASMGSGADIVSGGELYLALQAGFDPKKIVYASVGKRDDEISYAIDQGIRAFNVESEQELDVVNEIAVGKQTTAPVAIRVNPDIDIHGHPYISTGKSVNKFGIDIDTALDLFKKAGSLPGIHIDGVHCHIGSQILNLEYFVASAQKLHQFVGDLRGMGIEIHHVDIGGGLGVDYKSTVKLPGVTPERIPEPAELAEKVIPVLKSLNCEIYFEPGRSIIGEAGALISRVLYTKESRGKNFVVVDAGMNDLIRPSLYEAYHQIVPLKHHSAHLKKMDVVGPICETGDFLAKDRDLPAMERGEHLAVMTAGAYGYSLASNYNSRPRPAEVWVDEYHHEIIRERENYDMFIS